MMNSSVQTTNSTSGSSVAPQLSTSPSQQQQQPLDAGQQSTANRGGVQIQVLSGNGTQTSLNETATTANNSQDLLSQLGGIRLAPEQRQQLLLAAQLQQQLRSSPVVLQPALQGVALLPTTSVPTVTATAPSTSSTG